MAESLFTKILVPVDFSSCSEEAFRVALTLARTFQAELLLLHVIDTSALETFNQLGLLAVPSDAQGQKRRLRHHARLNVRRLLESGSTKDVTVTAFSFIAVHPVATFNFFIFRSRTKGRSGVATVRPVGARGTSPHIKVVATVMQRRQLPR